MEAVARSYLMAGVALVGAGAIAVGPVQALPPDIEVPATTSSAVAVELNALVNPIELWATVFSTTATNVGDLVETVLANPAPVLGKVVDNSLISAEVFASVASAFFTGFFNGIGTVPAQIQNAVTLIQEGNIYDGVVNLATAFLSPVVAGAFPAIIQLPNIVAVLQNPFDNISSVIAEAIPAFIGSVGFPLLTQVLAPVAQIGYTGQAIYDGVQAGDFEAVANAVISFPSDMVNTILNSSPPEIGIPGLLGPGGLVAGLLALRETIADAIHPPAVSSPPSLSVAEAPNLKAAAITVDTGDIAGIEGAATDGDTARGVGIEAAAATADDDGGVATEDEAEKSDDGAEVVKTGPAAKPSRLSAGAKGQARGSQAVNTLRADVQKSVKRFGDRVNKALGGKTKAEKKASTAGGGADE
ncbi:MULTISPECIES: hypothetical protein [Mycolicibacterium]|uniref:Uncharacterized protein n=1 Tax=Mycolicibacterium farcinogenes TaxID=1802 RepID=A0ACD1FKF8_MYCFR|nr:MULTISPECIES: hypothetical protein [Mycolicibacterium]MCW1824264.1 hypothetical protein [Mycolicibacterium senegalense]QZH67470.1 hypothetical protein K6L26_07450 [Mycolicibacterium farcinogenes]